MAIFNLGVGQSISLGKRASFSDVGSIGLGSFEAALGAFKIKSIQQVEKVVRKSILDVFKRITTRTPVDTGLARASWQVGIHPTAASPLQVTRTPILSPKGKVIGSRRVLAAPYSVAGKKTSHLRSGTGFAGRQKMPKYGKAISVDTTINRASSVIKSFTIKEGIIGYIFNNVSYVIYLEFGHSKQAPSGMVRISCAEFASIISGNASAIG